MNQLRTHYKIKSYLNELYAGLSMAEAIREAERVEKEKKFTLNKKSCIPFNLHYEEVPTSYLAYSQSQNSLLIYLSKSCFPVLLVDYLAQQARLLAFYPIEVLRLV